MLLQINEQITLGISHLEIQVRNELLPPLTESKCRTTKKQPSKTLFDF
jgi:hypothetical protein